MARRKRSSRRAENAFPLGLLGLGLALVAFLLPSALRPPAPQTPATAELSPDAPPDNKTDSLIAALHRSSSGIAGAGDLGAGDGLGLVPSAPAAPDTRACRHGYGNPPRQTESAYSAPCSVDYNAKAPPGSTYRNVSQSEVKVGFWHILGMPAERGPVPSECTSSMSAQLRTFCYLQKFWNDRYNFYGRYIRLDAAADDPPDDPGARAAAHTQAQAGDFAVVHLSDSFCDEFSNHLHLICMDGTSTHDYVQENAAPYWWTYQMNHEQNEAMYGEYACKKLVGRNSDFAGGNQKGKPRRIGVIVQSVAVTGFRTAEGIAKQVEKQCGYKVVEKVNIRDDDNSQSQATAVLKMQQAQVTTVLMWSDTSPWQVVMQNADANAYYPEWVALNSNGLDFNTSTALLPRLQTAHLFGMSGWEMPRPFSSTDCYKAYKAMDPANAPDATSCALINVSLEHIMNGIQMAGPNLTPKTFEQGMFKIGHPRPANNWEIGGGWGPGDRAFVDTFAEIWWDGTAVDPSTGNPGGAYRYTDNGRRYGFGEMTRDLKVFNPSDPTQAR
jgi:hypothetical protein